MKISDHLPQVQGPSARSGNIMFQKPVNGQSSMHNPDTWYPLSPPEMSFISQQKGSPLYQDTRFFYKKVVYKKVVLFCTRK